MPTMIVLIDNYDSFTYNLVQYLGDLDQETKVYRNDQIAVAGVMAIKPCAVVISPGPSDPDHAGICLDLVKACEEEDMPLLGVCLGHQTLGQALGGAIIKTTPLHGKVSHITHTNTSVFKDLPSPIPVARYHSLIIENATLPPALEITAQTDDGIIMGVAHRTKPLHGVQFHPESIATAHGHAMLKNFLNLL
jgi:anthranilate synthase component 2